jgi:hypothetical protein
VVLVVLMAQVLMAQALMVPAVLVALTARAVPAARAVLVALVAQVVAAGGKRLGPGARPRPGGGFPGGWNWSSCSRSP